MKKNQKIWNLRSIFVLAMAGPLTPLIRSVISEGFHFTAVESHNYISIAQGLISFFISFQIVERMNITKEQNEYYLSILGVYFLTTMILMLVFSLGYALFG